jgi:hypothetical protein
VGAAALLAPWGSVAIAVDGGVGAAIVFGRPTGGVDRGCSSERPTGAQAASTSSETRYPSIAREGTSESAELMCDECDTMNASLVYV